MTTFTYLVLLSLALSVVSAEDPNKVKAEINKIISFIQGQEKSYIIDGISHVEQVFKEIKKKCDQQVISRAAQQRESIKSTFVHETTQLIADNIFLFKDLRRINSGTMSQDELDKMMKAVLDLEKKIKEAVEKQNTTNKKMISEFEAIAQTCKISQK